MRLDLPSVSFRLSMNRCSEYQGREVCTMKDYKLGLLTEEDINGISETVELVQDVDVAGVDWRGAGYSMGAVGAVWAGVGAMM